MSGYVNRHVGTHCIRLPAAGRPQASLDHRTFASLDLCRISYGAAVRVTSPALESIFHLQILLRGHCLCGGGQEHALAPGELLLINPDDPVDLTYSADCEKFIVKLPCALLEAICAEQRWSHPARGVRSNIAIAWTSWKASSACSPWSAARPSPASGWRGSTATSEQILGSKLLTLLKTNVSREDPGDAQVVFARLDAYIRRHLQSEIEVAALAEQAHMSTRSLYALFERQLGESPRQYIRRLRLGASAPAWKTPAAGYATSPNWPWTSVSPTSAASPSNIAGSSASCLRKPCAGAPSADRHGVQESASDPQATDIPSSTRYLT